MVRTILFFFLILVSQELLSQANPSDMIVLRNKQGHTIKSYFPGIPITFADQGNRWRSGIVRKIQRDTLFLQQYDVRMAYNQWGGYVPDTITAYLIKFHINEIKWIRKPAAKFEFVRNGNIFIIGGTAYLILHLINSAYLKEPVVGSTVAIAGGIALGGMLMHVARKQRYNIGRKYSLKYVPM